MTVDTIPPGWRPRDLQRAWQPFLEGVGTANYMADPVFRSLLEKTPDEDPLAAAGQFVYQFSNPSLTWQDLGLLFTGRATGHRRGGRRGADNSPGQRSPLRRGHLQALALGADAVLIGRPYPWGLAAGGEDGVIAALRGLLAERDLTIGLSGYRGPGDLGAAARTRP